MVCVSPSDDLYGRPRLGPRVCLLSASVVPLCPPQRCKFRRHPFASTTANDASALIHHPCGSSCRCSSHWPPLCSLAVVGGRRPVCVPWPPPQQQRPSSSRFSRRLPPPSHPQPHPHLHPHHSTFTLTLTLTVTTDPNRNSNLSLNPNPHPLTLAGERPRGPWQGPERRGACERA